MPIEIPFQNRGFSSQQQRAAVKQLPIVAARSRADATINRDVRPAEHVFKGGVKVVGIGEALAEVKFPVFFLERPTFTYGAELAEGSVLIPTEYPTLSALAYDWDIADPDKELFGQSMRRWYRGVSLAIVTTGPVGTDMYVHYQFTGRAITNPVGGKRVVPPES